MAETTGPMTVTNCNNNWWWWADARLIRHVTARV